VRKRNRQRILENILVEDYAAEGKSLARVDGKVVFITDAVPGDRVNVLLSKNKKDWAEGRAVKILDLAAERMEPFCIHFGICGGCQWQMLPYNKQLEYKEKQVKETLSRIGKVNLNDFRPIIGADYTRYYRNKMEYTFGNKRFLLPHELADDKISAITNVAGFHAKGYFDKLVDITECHLQQEPTNRIRNLIRDYAINNNISFYDIRNKVGFLRNLQLRICRTGEIMANLVVRENNEDILMPLLKFIHESFPEITTLLYTINGKANDSIHDLEPQVYSGKGYVIEKLEGLDFKIGPKSFFQTNTGQAEKLYQEVRKFAGLSGSEVVYDLYCGTGSIGLFCSKGAKKIIGVEVIQEAVEDAQVNAELNGIQHAEFFSGDVSEICTPGFFASNGRPDIVITDPPRAGMSPALVEQLLNMESPVVIYVSCNPATQARDLNMMMAKYDVEAVQPVDMFPHTHHIENIVKLRLKV